MPDGANTISERPKPEAAAAADPHRDLLLRLNRDAATVAAKDPDLSRAIGQLTEGGNRPGRTEDPVHRTKAAYALQDYEKLAGPISTVPAALRDEMTRLAATAPGLKNERLQDLVKQTASLSDKGLVNDIRDLALVTGKQGGDQSRCRAVANHWKRKMNNLIGLGRRNRRKIAPHRGTGACSTALNPG